MSKRKSDEAYEKTFAYKFFVWLSGEKDPYLDTVEMKPQKEYEVTDRMVRKRERERQFAVRQVYDLRKNKQIHFFERIYKLMAVLFCILLAAMLLYNVSFLPETGAGDKAVNNEVSERYIESGLQETGAVNIVTGMILDYRAFDTFGESNVLFVATITVLILLHARSKSADEKKQALDDERFEPKNDLILQAGARILVPVIILFGIYIILNGHLSPGGGFSGGAVIGAGLILYLNAFGFEKTEKLFSEKTYKWISFGALSTYCMAKSYSFFTGANHLESHIPLGIPGHILSSGLILLLNICVGLVVACTMYTFYVMFRKGDF